MSPVAGSGFPWVGAVLNLWAALSPLGDSEILRRPEPQPQLFLWYHCLLQYLRRAGQRP